MRDFFKRLDSRIGIYFFVISMLIVAILSYTNYRFSVSVLMTSKRNQVNQEIESASGYISSYLDKMKALSEMIAMTKDIDKISGSDMMKDESFQNIIDITKKNDPLIRTISIISRDGRLLSTSPSPSFLLSPDMQQVEWYQKALQEQNMAYISDGNHEESAENSDRVISISHEIVDKNQNHVGLVLIDLSYAFIEDYVSSMNFRDPGYAFITSREESRLFDLGSCDSGQRTENEKYLKILHDRKKMIGEDFISAKTCIPNTEWQLVGVVSTGQIRELRRQIIESSFFWAMLILLLSVVLSYFLSRRITGPIVNVVREMKKVESDFRPVEIDRHASREIQILTQEYNSLLERIRRLTKSIEEKENTRRIYELKALQSQINPHFIYNTLETIIWLTELRENQKSVQVTKALGRILHNTLNINEDFIPLSQELEHVRNYMDIQKIRYDDKFEYQFKIAKNTEDLPVPKLILQPIVENAIYHGIKPKRSPSYICISSRIEDGVLLLFVENNGVAPEQDSANRIKNRLGGIGMKNVDQRIKLLCGRGYGVELTREQEITRVSYRLRI